LDTLHTSDHNNYETLETSEYVNHWTYEL